MNTCTEGTAPQFKRNLLVLALVVTSLPYVVAFFTTPAGHVYTWILPPYPEDSLAYLAWSRQALNGDAVFRLKYTAAPHEALLIQPFFYLAGLLGRITRLDLGLVHLLLKSIGVLVFFRGFFGLLAVLKVPPRQTRLAAILAMVSSGFGGLLAVSMSPQALAWLRPADLWLVDLNTYWSLLWNPLFPFSLALIVYCIRWIVEGAESGAVSCWPKAGLATALLALLHPYHIPMLYLFFAISVATQLPRHRWLTATAWYFGISLPLVAYAARQPSLHPLLADHAITGRMESPELLGMALGCGLLLIGSITAVIQMRPRLHNIWPLVLWPGLSLTLAYCPFWFQRKFFFALELPFCVLTALVLVRVFKPAWRWVIVGIMATTPIYLTISQYQEMHKPSPTNPYYVQNDLVDALNFLRKTTDPKAVVFASWEVSRLVPAFSGNTAVWGHWAQTVDSQQTLQRLRRVFNADSGLNDAQRAGQFWQLGMEYIIADASLKTLLGGELPEWLIAETKVAWRNGDIAVLERVTPVAYPATAKP